MKRTLVTVSDELGSEQWATDPQVLHGFDLPRSLGATPPRAAAAWTQRQLETYSGIDQTVISRLENGKHYGLRWARFARTRRALDGLDVAPGQEPPPWPGHAPEVHRSDRRCIDCSNGDGPLAERADD